MLQSIEVDDSEIVSAAGYIPQIVKVVEAQPEGGIIPRFTSYIIKSVCVKTEGSSVGMSYFSEDYIWFVLFCIDSDTTRCFIIKRYLPGMLYIYYICA